MNMNKRLCLGFAAVITLSFLSYASFGVADTKQQTSSSIVTVAGLILPKPMKSSEMSSIVQPIRCSSLGERCGKNSDCCSGDCGATSGGVCFP